MLLTDSEAVADFCRAARQRPYVAVDTEFERRRTYYARLCLVQVAHGDHVAAVDPLAEGLELGPLRDLLLDPSVTKVMHASAQDLEVLYQAMGRVPGPVFDTQIAAGVVGLGKQLGYAPLVQTLLGQTLDKAPRDTNWARRPLSERQVAYALADVTWLCGVYEHLAAEVERQGRAAQVDQSMAALLDEGRYKVEPEDAWRRIKVRRTKRQTLAVLAELAAWRERSAMARDLPRAWVAKDGVLIAIANRRPATREDLAEVPGIEPRLAKGAEAEAILAAVRQGARTA